MPRYIPNQIESKWQEYWEKEGIYSAQDNIQKPKYYALVMFPYPSGDGLHVGHTRNYIAGDITARYKRAQGFNVLHPIGWDGFGLPAENAAIKKGIHPRINTDKNIANFKRQIKSLGISYNWEREIDTTDPNYYKWTQWIFLKLFKHSLAYQEEAPVNWCPSCKTGLANEEVVAGMCERCGTSAKKRYLKQWILKITEYADQLLADLEGLDWPKKIKIMQQNWIGRSEGTMVKFGIQVKIKNQKSKIKTTNQNSKIKKREVEVFTTRPDTLFGATYLVLAPEHKIIQELKFNIENWKEIETYIDQVKNKSDLERTALIKDKTGVELKGIKAINPVNEKELPIWIADYVLASYGTGAIMAVPAHDQRDFEFAKKFNLPIIKVIQPKDKSSVENECWTSEGILTNSEQFSGLPSEQAKQKITEWLQEKNLGKKATSYKLRDWVFSRQRYWGEPIPIIHCGKCGVVPVPEEDLPVRLPEVEKYEPTGTGESPLAAVPEFVNTNCPKCGGAGKRETNTMPQWAGSCWYFLRYTDPKNNEKIFDENKIKYWMPVDIYTGGAEHAVLHLLYARFWHKVLYDDKIVNTKEPFIKLRNQGMVLGKGGVKMSKSKGNVVNPDDIVKRYGADTLRIYEMFMGPFEDTIEWNPKSIEGSYRFLRRIWHFITQAKIDDRESRELERHLHKLIKKITDDIETMKFNTAVSSFMEFVNFAIKEKSIKKITLKTFLILFNPLAPHISEGLWHFLEPKSESVNLEKWPKYDKEKIKDEIITLAVQINGKTRDSFSAPSNASEDEIKQLTVEREKVKRYMEGKEIKRVIFVKGRLINIVV